MTTLDERYPDLLGHGDDPELARLVADLDKAYAASTPPPHLRVSLQRTLHERMSALHVPRQTAPARSLRLLSWPRRPILAAVALLAAVVMAGAAYAYISLVDQAYSQTSGLLPVMQKYGHRVNLSQSTCSYTMTVQQVYADANRVIVGYTLGGPANRKFMSLESDWPTLTDTRHTYMEHLALGQSLTMLAGAGGHYAAFDASAIARNARLLRLRMTLPSVTMVEKLGDSEPRAVPCERYSSGPSVKEGRDPRPVRTRIVMVNKPLSVSFSVPVDPARREVAPHQTVSAGGTALVLERVVVTRTETRVYLRRTTPGHILENADLMLYAGQRRYGEGIPLFWDWWVRVAPASRLYDFWFAGPLYGYHGPWKLVVRAQPDVGTASWRKLRGGPWVFYFRVP